MVHPVYNTIFVFYSHLLNFWQVECNNPIIYRMCYWKTNLPRCNETPFLLKKWGGAVTLKGIQERQTFFQSAWNNIVNRLGNTVYEGLYSTIDIYLILLRYDKVLIKISSIWCYKIVHRPISLLQKSKEIIWFYSQTFWLHQY